MLSSRSSGATDPDNWLKSLFCEAFLNGGRSWIRASEGVSQQIYSLPPLATWVSYHSPSSLQGRGFKPNPVAPLKRKLLFFNASLCADGRILALPPLHGCSPREGRAGRGTGRG